MSAIPERRARVQQGVIRPRRAAHPDAIRTFVRDEVRGNGMVAAPSSKGPLRASVAHNVVHHQALAHISAHHAQLYALVKT